MTSPGISEFGIFRFAEVDLDPNSMMRAAATVDRPFMMAATSFTPPPAPEPRPLLERVRAHVEKVGIVRAPAQLRVSRPTIERILGGLRVHPGVVLVVTAALDEYDAARATRGGQ